MFFLKQHEHCPHPDLTENRQVCCHCGKVRYSHKVFKSTEGHGPYEPKKKAVGIEWGGWYTPGNGDM